MPLTLLVWICIFFESMQESSHGPGCRLDGVFSGKIAAGSQQIPEGGRVDGEEERDFLKLLGVGLPG